MKIFIVLILMISTAWAQTKENFSQAVKNDIQKPDKYELQERPGRFPASVIEERMEDQPLKVQPKKLDNNFRQVTPERW